MADSTIARATRTSIIVAAYQSGRYIGRCIESGLSQTDQDLELIVVDDGSNDDTCEIVEEWQALDIRVRLIRTGENKGPSCARNTGIAAARGRWIAILDSDDVFLPDRLVRLVAQAEAADADMASDNLLIFDENAAQEAGRMFAESDDIPPVIDSTSFLVGNLPDEHFPRRSFGFFKPIFRAGFLRDTGLRYREDLGFAEDFDLYIRALLAGAKWVTTNEALYRYSVRNNSLTSHHRAAQLRKLVDIDSALMRHPAIIGSETAARALGRHLAATRRRHQVARFAEAIGERRYAELTRLFVRHPNLYRLHAGMLLDRLGKRVKSRGRERSRIFGIDFCDLTLDDVVDRVLRDEDEAWDGPRTILTANLDHVVNLSGSREFRRAYERAWLATVDGMPVLAYARLRRLKVPHRVTGADLFAALMEKAVPSRHRFFFVAPTQLCGDALVERLRTRGFSRSSLATYVPEPGFESDQGETSRLLRAIHDHRPTHLFFGVGSPKSEIWAEHHRSDLPRCYVFHVGAALGFYADSRLRAPAWMQRAGLEWFWRWLHEPRRLFVRYFVRSWAFPWQIAKDLLSGHHRMRV